MESEGRFLGCLFRKCGALPLLSALSLLSALQLWPIWPSEPNPEVDVPTWWPRGGSPSSRRVCPPWRRRAARTSPGGRSRWSETCPAPGWRCPVWWARGGRALQACPAAKTARARERERERKRNGREMNPGKGRRKGGARESKKWARPCHFTVTLRGFCWRFYPKWLTTVHSRRQRTPLNKCITLPPQQCVVRRCSGGCWSAEVVPPGYQKCLQLLGLWICQHTCKRSTNCHRVGVLTNHSRLGYSGGGPQCDKSVNFLKTLKLVLQK